MTDRGQRKHTVQLALTAALFFSLGSLFLFFALPAAGLRAKSSVSTALISEEREASGRSIRSASEQVVASASRPASSSACEPECGQAGAGALSNVRLKPTALYSFPGSGNTWLRHLLTTASGLLTGAVYNAYDDVSTTGPASLRVIAVKTHKTIEATRQDVQFVRTLMLVRSPYDALLAQFNRQGDYGSNRSNNTFISTAVRPPEAFKTDWPKYIRNRNSFWREKNLEWSQDQRPLHVIVYNRLVANMAQELRHVFNFLNESSITPRIHCAVKDSEGHAHRQKPAWLEKAVVYPDDAKIQINHAIDEVQKALEAKTGQSFHDFQQWKK